MTKLFIVDLNMCGGENLPPDFDLEDFCEVLQGKVSDVEIVPANGFHEITNRNSNLLENRLMEEAIGEYCPR